MSKWTQAAHAVSLARAHGEDARCVAAGSPALLWVGVRDGPRSMHLIHLELTMLVAVSGLSWRAKVVI